MDGERTRHRKKNIAYNERVRCRVRLRGSFIETIPNRINVTNSLSIFYRKECLYVEVRV
jgi:Trm5-related predicted tRNA methylase